MSKPNVLVFGLGGIGGVYACTLQLSGTCNVHVVARSNYDKVKNKGLRIVSPVLGDHDSVNFAGGELWLSYPPWNELIAVQYGSRVRRLQVQVSTLPTVHPSSTSTTEPADSLSDLRQQGSARCQTVAL